MLSKSTGIIVFTIILLLGSYGLSSAKLNNYVYPYDISEIEWKVLNWTAAWKGTTTPADPFILDRMEYSRKDYKINVYVKGKSEDDTEDNRNKSIEGITKTLKDNLAQFDPKTDLTVHYTISQSDDPTKTYELTYDNGSFDSSSIAPSASTSY